MTRRTALQFGLGLASAQIQTAYPDRVRLLVDSRLTSRTRNLKLAIAPCERFPSPLTIDGKPIWCQDNLNNSIWREPDGEFRGMWGEPMPDVLQNHSAGHLMRSRDGLAWETYGNWVMRPCAIMRDDREKDPNRRYKAVFRASAFTGRATDPTPKGQMFSPVGMFSAMSPDAQSWLEFYPIVLIHHEPGVKNWRVGSPSSYWVGGDSNPGVLWAPSLNRYVALFRTNIETGAGKRRERGVGHSDSEDFQHWTPHQLIVRGDPYGAGAHGLPQHDIHSMQAWYRGGVYLGILEPYYWKDDRMHLELAWSPDMRHWERICPGTDLIPHPPPGEPGNGCRFIACGNIQVGDEVWIYWGADSERFLTPDRKTKKRLSSLFLAKFKRDRFAGWRTAGPGPGQLQTAPFPAGQSPLCLNANASQGAIFAELCDPNGAPLPNFTQREFEALRTDGLAMPLSWKGKNASRDLGGKMISLKLILEGEAKAYALEI